MKRFLGFLPFIFFFLCIALPTSSLSTTRGIRVTAKQGRSLYLYKDYYALVIGISNYEKWPKLPNAVNDAREVASRLKELGFEVKLVLDPTAREIRTALGEMVYKMGSEANRALLFYYAGHCETETLADRTKMGYIVPKDCPLLKRDPMGFASHAISMRDIESASLRIKAKHVIMLFDSCFSGSLFALVRAIPADITEKSGLPVRQYITAGREDEQVLDKSMFKRCFLIGLEGDADLTGDGYITGSELGMYLSDKVVNYTHRRQHPQYGKINNPDLDRGDFIFVPLKVRQKEVAEEKKLAAEESAIAEELQKLREERRKSEELIERLTKLLETSAQKEGAQSEALEEEIKRLKAELERTSQIAKELQAGQAGEKRLAYAPKTTSRVYDILRNGQGPFVVDDFEDKDLWSTGFDAKWGYRSIGLARISVSVDTTRGASGTSSSMKIDYEVRDQSVVFTAVGGRVPERIEQVEKDRSRAYDFSRFKKITFYLKGKKGKSFFSRPNKLFFTIVCYDKDVKAKYGDKFAEYYNKTAIFPEKEWKRVEIPFHDFIPSIRTKRNAMNYTPNPDLSNVLTMLFMFSGSKGHDDSPGSNTVWIDEITLE